MTDNPNPADGSETGTDATGVSAERAAEQEFDDAAQKPKQTQTLSEADKYVLEERDRKRDEAIKGNLSDAVKNLHERDELKAVHTDILEGELHRRAASDETFKKHFFDQDKNPDAWKGDLDALAVDMAEKVKPGSNKTTEDLVAANASVRGDSTEAPNGADKNTKSNKEVAEMSDFEFKTYIEEDSRY